MAPETNKNLDAFLKEFDKYGAYYLMPVKLRDKPGVVPDLESRKYFLKGHRHSRDRDTVVRALSRAGAA